MAARISSTLGLSSVSVGWLYHPNVRDAIDGEYYSSVSLRKKYLPDNSSSDCFCYSCPHKCLPPRGCEFYQCPQCANNRSFRSSCRAVRKRSTFHFFRTIHNSLRLLDSNRMTRNFFRKDHSSYSSPLSSSYFVCKVFRTCSTVARRFRQCRHGRCKFYQGC
ncbi:hypothetical protein PUN28_018265 [Cardiocondyla obscurior]|uniref:Uncharacterized protein n=1 Tax=Cardiocondyla obscurior TaxID=286306 RepID=A0AAW2EJC9_9HYME